MSTPAPDLAEACAYLRQLAGSYIAMRAADLQRIGRDLLAIMGEYDRRADRDLWRDRALAAEQRDDGQAWADLIAVNERMGEALTEIGMALGLPKPSARLHWGAPEILRRIRAQQAECEQEHGHPVGEAR